MTLKELIDANTARAKRWHNGHIEEWSALEWAAAMAGEAGEACNAAKKLKRLECQIASINADERNPQSEQDAKIAVAKECADTIIYALLVFERVGIDAEYMIAQVFNTKSAEYGFPERI
jgi:NTP pyrophosphatase (non-canonical NTP hydrolase)